MLQRFSQQGFYFRFGTRIKIYTYKIYSLSASLAQGKEEKGGRGSMQINKRVLVYAGKHFSNLNV